MIGCSKKSGPAQAHVKSFVWDNMAQHGQTFAPGQNSQKSRAKRIEDVIQAVDYHFANPGAAQHHGQGSQAPVGTAVAAAQGHGAHRAGGNADLNGVGQQFYGGTRH